MNLPRDETKANLRSGLRACADVLRDAASIFACIAGRNLRQVYGTHTSRLAVNKSAWTSCTNASKAMANNALPSVFDSTHLSAHVICQRDLREYSDGRLEQPPI